MKASELITQLQDIIWMYGDRELEVNGEYNSDYPINTESRLQVTRVLLLNDSENFQILIDNEK